MSTHPVGRLIDRREPYDVDMLAVVRKCRARNIALELNAHPERLDLTDIPDNIKNRLDIHPVKWIDQVLKIALERQPEPLRHGLAALALRQRQRCQMCDQL